LLVVELEAQQVAMMVLVVVELEAYLLEPLAFPPQFIQ
jgi:hypothetical protein